jgi:hypothetical protein
MKKTSLIPCPEGKSLKVFTFAMTSESTVSGVAAIMVA